MGRLRFTLKIISQLLLFITIVYADPQNLFINEFLASNLVHSQDDFNEYDDWIELYNASDTSVNISGYYITDNLNNLTKSKFPQNDTFFVINPGDYLIIWADGEPFQGDRHVSFRLDKDGEEIALIGLDGETIIDQIIYGYQRADISMGRDSLNSNDLSFFMLPSMGVENGVGYQGFADAPDFLPTGGYYDQSQIVLMSYPYDSHTLHYTLDLSDPTEDDPLYISGVDIANTSVLRARTFQDNFIPSSITSHNYLINESYSLPVLAILTNPENFWNDTTGIYVNYLDEGILWERRCTNQYFTQDSLHFSLESGIRIQGSSSRGRQKKSFRLYYKNAYEQDRLLYPIFGPSEPTSFKNLVLRAGYDDDIQMDTGTLLRDPLGSELWSRMGMLVSRGNFANLYLNDQYWGIYNIRESINEHFIKDHTGYLEFDLIRYIKNEDNPASLPSEIPYLNSDLKYGTLTEWESLNEFMCTSDFTNDSIFVEATNLIDMENYLNLQALIIFSQYQSWTFGVSAYREQNPLGKWRWTLWDMDRAFTKLNWNGFTFSVGSLSDTTGVYAPNIYALRLLQNEQFKTNYINRIADFLNSTFLPGNVISIIDSLNSLISPDIPNEVDRWDMQVEHWINNVDTLRLFAENRPAIVRQQLLEYFSLSGSNKIIIDATEGGTIMVNSLSPNQYPWEGVYFQNIPIRIKAIPNEGYQFVNWQGVSGEMSNSDSISIILTGDSTLTAVFGPTLSVDGELFIPAEYSIHQNYPNPFNPTTTLRFDLPEVSDVTLTIYNMLGQKVRTFNYQNTSAGYHSVTWDATNDLGQQVGAGVYLYQLQAKDFVKTRKMVLLK